MKKILACIVITVILFSSALTLIPRTLADASAVDDIKVQNYSYHLDFSGTSPLLVVVGEVKNVGSTAYQLEPILGTVYGADGNIQAQSPGYVQTIYLIPGQKMPFEITFNSPKTSADGTWISASIGKIDFTVQATQTNSYASSQVKVVSQTNSIDSTSAARGTYWINGEVENSGSQTAEKIFVIATFYNSSGATVAFGYSAALNLTASQKAPFQLGAFDLNMSQISPQQQITSYSLVAIPKAPVLTGPPFPDPSEYGLVADSAASHTDTTPTPGTSTSDGNSASVKTFDYNWLIYGAIAAIVIIAVALTIVRMPKRSASAKKARTKGVPQKASPKKLQGKLR